jgi:hypothetical protein
MRSRLIALGGLLLMAAPAVRAEVRLVHQAHDARVQIKATARGIWTPVGQADADVLNPEGDLRGDGAPALLRGAGTALAWTRPSASQVVLAEATTTWLVEEVIEAPGVMGTPVGAINGSDRFVAWARSDGTAILGMPGPDLTVDLGVGMPVAVAIGLSDIKVILRLPAPAPYPIPTMRIVTLRRERDGLFISHDEDVPLGTPRWTDVELSDVTCSGAPEPTAVAWWLSRGTLTWLVLDDGPASPSSPVAHVPRSRQGIERTLTAAVCAQR